MMGGMKIASTNPARNYEVIDEVSATPIDALPKLVERARHAQPAWASLSQSERNQAYQSFVGACRSRAEELATTMSREMGKPIVQARAHIKWTYSFFEAYFQMAESALAPEVVFEDAHERHTQYREPRGVIACIAPWNFPFLNLAWQTAQALLAGNVILYKPSEEIPVFTNLLIEIVKQSDLPEGVFTIVIGDGQLGEALVRQPVDAISFTGSARTGRRISQLAGRNLTPVMLELGGSAPGIVLADADVDRVIEAVYDGRFGGSGQFCDGLKRLIVHESLLDQVLVGLKRVNQTKRVGDPLDEATDIGPLVAKRQVELLQAQLDDALAKGAEVVFGGGQPEGLKGAYFQPTVLKNVNRDMRVWYEEVFGPVVTFNNEAEAIESANDTEYGLGGYVFTEDVEIYRRLAGQLKTGQVCHNTAQFYSPHSPFGGYKHSGNSRTNGVAGFHEFTQIKLVSEELG
jgi:acyl-CoA reductase-like NAD-dependent aldehyde dehydrogenase